MTNTFEASLTALKLSYLRFVSDLAPGLLLVGTLLVLERTSVGAFARFPMDATFRTVALVLLVLLAAPFGLLINGAGHFCLGGIQEWIERRCFSSKSWPIKETREVLSIDRWETYFRVTDANWPGVAHEVDDLLDTFVPHLAALLDHVRALKKFCRSIAFLAVVGLFVAAGAYGGWALVALLAGMVASLVGPRFQRWTRFVPSLFVLEAAILVATGCYWLKPAILAFSLLLIAASAILLAGFVDFYQHGLTMLFVYQLLVKEDEGFEISATRAREGLSAFVQSRASQKVGAVGG